MTMQEQFLYWVRERENIRKRKEDGEPRPWTNDPILQDNRFCNVRRRDDKVSRWLINNVYSTGWEKANPPNGWVPFFMFTSLCRFINWPPTLMEMLENQVISPGVYGISDALEVMEDRARRKEKVFGNAYLIKGSGTKGVAKAPHIVEVICGSAIQERVPQIRKALDTRSKEEVAKVLMTISGWGSFMSGQVVDDLTWTSLLRFPKDEYTWAPMGPGSKRGFNRMLGRDLNASVRSHEWSGWLQEWRQLIWLELGDEFHDLTLHDIQNCLCEFDKYQRVKEGGQMKNKYVPKAANEW